LQILKGIVRNYWYKHAKFIFEKMKKDGKSFALMSPESPIAILVSVRQHDLKLASDSCKETVETEEICQK